VPTTAPFGFAPYGLDRRAAPAEGDNDARTLIDNLVAGAVGGDVRARDDLLALIQPLVLKYCRARLGRQESLMSSADDVAQDVCMAVVSALPNYQLKGLSFRAFVYGIAAHKVADAQRAAVRGAAVTPVESFAVEADQAPGPGQRAVSGDLARRLTALLARLPETQREIVLLRVAAGLSAEEVGAIVGMSAPAVRVAQSRALARLRTLAGDSLGEAAA